MKKFLYIGIAVIVAGLVAGCGSQEVTTNEEPTQKQVEPLDENRTVAYRIAAQELTKTTALSILNNKAAYVSSQCYTKTVDENNVAHNPCFSCHINSAEPNYVDDADLQASYNFSEYTATNRWTNLFKDRTQQVANITNDEMLHYVRQSNYFDENKSIVLNAILASVPNEWDYNSDGVWSGYRPDCYFNFDTEGFDQTPEGDYTGWRAFAYYPFLGTFWPTNGSMDDVLIRLPKVMREDKNKKLDLKVYKINLAVVESLIKKKSIKIESVDEKVYGVDLNNNGILDVADEVVYNWVAPKYDFTTKKYTHFSMHYVGAAKEALINNDLHIAPGLYPEGTEFLHSVRYMDVQNNNSLVMAPRMKELRYSKKTAWNTYPELNNATKAEIKEKEVFPDRLRTISGDAEHGLRNGLGWRYQGFIEDKKGYLRPQTYEETLFCIGCHSGIGATVDSSFVFSRKLDEAQGVKNWYHWSQKGLEGIKEPKLDDGRYEYELYLQANGAGDEFRDNQELQEKFFDLNGSLKSDELVKARDNIAYLLLPSVERALELDKAYKTIVEEQSFIYGRDAHVKPVTNVHQKLEPKTDTNVTVIAK
ncbi:hypothetical protein [Sulfurimonas microaerophilic]|uniref:hypothetical protein n=1 Tax=Sulfurimonas microaerophilic TaxID=3058392 RepID=UPI0027153A43|nr:hypothetical protein [Sulfurimonas sp. hsl 1-7]